MEEPSERLRRILEELTVTRVEDGQPNIIHLNRAYNELSRLWAVTRRAERGELAAPELAHQPVVRLTIWNRHKRLRSLCDEFFRNGSPDTFARTHVTSLGRHHFGGTRDDQTGAPTHTVYTFALTSPETNKDLPRCRRP